MTNGSNINAILGFSFDPAGFAKEGSRIVTEPSKNDLEKAQRELRKIREMTDSPDLRPPDAEEDARTFWRLVGDAAALRRAFGTRRAARRLAWSLTVPVDQHDWIARSTALESALLALGSEPGSKAVLGVFDCLLRVWDNEESREILISYLKMLLGSYSGRRRGVIGIRDQPEMFLNSMGAKTLAARLFEESDPLDSAAESVGSRGDLQSSEYFLAVGEEYVNKLCRNAIDSTMAQSVLAFLGENAKKESYLRLLAPMIVALGESPVTRLRDELELLAVNNIGDPIRQALWLAVDIDPGRRAQYEQARLVVSSWIAQRFIALFFDKFDMEADRKTFWLKYAMKVSEFRIFGDWSLRQTLLRDPRLKPVMNRRFALRRDNGSDGLVLLIADRTYIEFSLTKNACYVFKGRKKEVFEGSYVDVGAFRDGSFQLLFNSRGNNIKNLRDEGRVLHKSGWEVRFAKWFNRRGGIS